MPMSSPAVFGTPYPTPRQSERPQTQNAPPGEDRQGVMGKASEGGSRASIRYGLWEEVGRGETRENS